MRFFNDRFYTYKIQCYKKTNDVLYELAMAVVVVLILHV